MSEDHRCNSCWPLLGHWSTYPDSLHSILKIYAQYLSRSEELEHLMNGAHAKSRTQALKLGSYLAGMGLLEKTKSGKYTPSKAGNQYIDSYSAVPIQNALRKNLKYISEIEQLLADRQLTISSLKTELAEKYEINWKSDWQIRFRLNWMRAFDMAERLTEKQSTGRYPEWRLR